MVPVLALASCGGGGEGGEAAVALSASNIGKEFVLGYGETADVGALSLEFTGVVDDSRCPTDGIVVCAWEGNGQILVGATDGQVSQVLTLNTNPKFSTFAIFRGYLIELRRLDPLPVSNVTRAPEDYSATLLVERN
jgi:hypothetical protein